MVTVALPLLVGLITTRITSAGTKAILLLVIAAAKTFLEAWISAAQAATPFRLIPVLMNVVINLAIAVAVHYGIWKPTGASAKAQDTLVRAP
jgi:hypothetical protein